MGNLYLGKEFLKVDKNYSVLRGLSEAGRKRVSDERKIKISIVNCNFTIQTAIFTDKFRGNYAAIQYVDSFWKFPYKRLHDRQYP